MTFARFEEKAVVDFTGFLGKAGFLDGDTMTAGEIGEATAPLFYRGFDIHPESRRKDAIVFDVVPLEDGRFADNVPVAYNVSIGIDINTSLAFGSEDLLELCDRFEDAFAGSGWRLFRTGSTKEANGRNLVSYTAMKVFAMEDGNG